MPYLSILLPLIAGYATIILADFIWLGFVARNFLIREFGALVELDATGSLRINLSAWLVTWAVIVVMIYVFVIRSGYAISYGTALGYGALLGFLSYTMYDLTNLTFLKWYSLAFTMVDIVWGTFLSAIVSLVMYTIYRMF